MVHIKETVLDAKKLEGKTMEVTKINLNSSVSLSLTEFTVSNLS